MKIGIFMSVGFVVCRKGFVRSSDEPNASVLCPFIHLVGNPNFHRHPKRFYEARRSDRNHHLVIPEFPGAAVAPGTAGSPDRFEMGP